MIYLASPYSHPSATVVEERFEAACAHVARMVKEGEVPYSPIVHFHPVAVRHKLAGDFTYWRMVNLHMLAKAQALHVLQLSGWQESIGVMEEISYACDHHIEIEYIPHG